MGTFAGKPPGSGANFKKLSGALAARGAHNPGALAAWIGRRKYGKRRFAKLGHMHSNLSPLAILLAGPEPYSAGSGETVKCPYCGKMNAPDARYCDQCGRKLPDSAYGDDSDDQYQGGGSTGLQTPAEPLASKTGFSGQQVTARGQGGTSTAGSKTLTYANGKGRSIELSRRMPVVSPDDLVVSRSQTGSAIIRHRRGGDTLGEIRHRDDGKWVAVTTGGKEFGESAHQRSALLSLIRTYNTGTTTLQHAARESALQPPPEQTPLMQQFGIPAIRLATPSNGASDGPRVTESSGDDLSGLSPRGATIYKKLIKRGFSAARAKAFAARAQNFGGAGK